MPEDDDLNFPLIALGLLEARGRGFTTDDVAQSWLGNLPGGRVFTAERIVYRNLLDGDEPEVAGAASATRSATGSARRSARTSTAGRTRAIPSRQPVSPGPTAD